MAGETKIEWADATFNPWIGCTRVSPACDDCYAARSTPARSLGIEWGAGAQRHRTSAANWANPVLWNERARKGRFVQCAACGRREFRKWDAALPPGGLSCCSTPGCLALPESESDPVRPRVFCASLADVFDNEVDPAWRADLFRLIWQTPNLDWLVLTKRIGNVWSMTQRAMWDSGMHGGMHHSLPKNVWLGATVVNQEEAARDIPKLLAVPAAARFVSIEPMLGPINLRALKVGRHELDALTGAWCGYSEVRATIEESLSTLPIPLPEMLPPLDWAICGGESGPKARPLHPDWARSLRDQCAQAFTPFHFKQWGEWTHVPTVEDSRNIPPDQLRYFRDIDASFRKAGKKRAGRLLDGRTHDEFPGMRITA